MSDLHEARDPKREPQIDMVGWVFSVFAVAITVAAVMAADQASEATTPVSHMVAR